MTIGIYFVKNKVSGRVYVGQSTNIENRLLAHKRVIIEPDIDKSRSSKKLLVDCKNYKPEDFEYGILEVCNKENLHEKEREWIIKTRSNEEKYGYNIRCNISGENNPNYGNTWSDCQKSKMSETKKIQHSSGDIYGEEWKDKISKNSKNMWKDEELKSKMATNVGLKKEKYTFTQMTMEGEIVKVWDSMRDILLENPDYHKQAIYSTCSGYKKSYKKYKWSKKLKI